MSSGNHQSNETLHVWNEVLEGFGGASAYSLWTQLDFVSMPIKTSEKRDIFEKFILYGLRKCQIVEYDDVKNSPIFSGDEPEDVARRILSGWPDGLPEHDLEINNEFMNYMYMLGTFANLQQGVAIVPFA